MSRTNNISFSESTVFSSLSNTTIVSIIILTHSFQPTQISLCALKLSDGVVIASNRIPTNTAFRQFADQFVRKVEKGARVFQLHLKKIFSKY